MYVYVYYSNPISDLAHSLVETLNLIVVLSCVFFYFRIVVLLHRLSSSKFDHVDASKSNGIKVSMTPAGYILLSPTCPPSRNGCVAIGVFSPTIVGTVGTELVLPLLYSSSSGPPRAKGKPANHRPVFDVPWPTPPPHPQTAICTTHHPSHHSHHSPISPLRLAQCPPIYPRPSRKSNGMGESKADKKLVQVAGREDAIPHRGVH